MYRKLFLLLLLVGIGVRPLLAQDISNVDSAFLKARHFAFTNKYDSAKNLCRKILVKTPNYSDVRVLLGRVYFWNNQTDSAFYELKTVLSKKPYEDAFIALADMERWTDNYDTSLFYTKEGLSYFPNSEDLVIKKARALHALQKDKAAYHILDSLLTKDEKNNEARQLAESIKRTLYENILSLSYSYDHFSNQFPDDWHLVSLSYTRLTQALGSVVFRVNWADRFLTPGEQFEMDMYPSVGKKMYMYLNAGYSPSTSIFPEYRAGASLYRSLPGSFEADLGFRLLYFGSPTVLYTGSIGKYYKNFWFSFRPTFIAYNNATVFSGSYALTTRYYTKSANDYYSLMLEYGISPDDYSQETLFKYPFEKSYAIRLGYQTSYKYKNIFYGSIELSNQGFYYGSELNYGNDYTITIGYQRYF